MQGLHLTTQETEKTKGLADISSTILLKNSDELSWKMLCGPRVALGLVHFLQQSGTKSCFK